MARIWVAATAAAVLFTGPFSSAPAATLTWDGGGANNSWSTLANWSPDQAPVGGDILMFGGSTRTSPSNNISGLSVGQLYFNTGAAAFTLSGNGFTLNGLLRNNSSNLQAINNTITLGASITVQATSGGLSFGALALNGNSLTLSATQPITFNGAISGNGSSGGFGVDIGGGTVTFAGSAATMNSYTGSTRVLGVATLRLGQSNRIPDGSAMDVNGSGSVLDLNGFSEALGSLSGGGSVLLGSGNLTVGSLNTSTGFSGAISGTGKVTKVGSGDWRLGGTLTHTGGTEIRGGSVTLSQFAPNALPDAGALLIENGTLSIEVITEQVGAVTLNGTGAISGSGQLLGSSYTLNSGQVSARLAGTAGITKATAGTVTLTGSNTYSGTTQILGGTLRVTNAIPNASAVVIDGGTLHIDSLTGETVGTVTIKNGSVIGAGTLTATSYALESGSIDRPFGGSGGLTKSTSGTFTLNAAGNYSGVTTISDGVLVLGGTQRLPIATALTVSTPAILRMSGFNQTVGSLAGGGTVDMGAGTLTVSGSASYSFAGAISGTGGLTKQGSGSLTLQGANTYTGATQLVGGTLALAANNVLADTTTVTLENATLALGSFSDQVAKVTLRSGTISASGGVLTSTGGFDVWGGTIGARLAGTGGLNKLTDGTVLLGPGNTYIGPTSINGGTLVLTGNDAIPDTSEVGIASTGVLNLNGFSDAVLSLGAGGSVVLPAASQLTVKTTSGLTSYSGVISGTGSLTMDGSGKLTLTGANSYAGATQVRNGTLALPGGIVLPGAQIDVLSTGTLEAQGLVNRRITGSGTLRADGNLIVGEIAGGTPLQFDGTLDVGSRVVQLISPGAARLGGSVLLSTGRLTAFNQGSGIELASGGTVTATRSAFIDGNFLNQGVVRGPTNPGQVLTFTDDVTGPGSYSGNILFSDAFSPGSSPGEVFFENVAFDSGAELRIDLAGTVAGAEFDVLRIQGTATLDGTLAVKLINGFMPALGESFEIMTFAARIGDFSGFTGLQLNELLYLAPRAYATAYVLEVQAVPEPSTWALIVAGLGASWLAARRRRQLQSAC